MGWKQLKRQSDRLRGSLTPEHDILIFRSLTRCSSQLPQQTARHTSLPGLPSCIGLVSTGELRVVSESSSSSKIPQMHQHICIHLHLLDGYTSTSYLMYCHIPLLDGQCVQSELEQQLTSMSVKKMSEDEIPGCLFSPCQHSLSVSIHTYTKV